MESLALLLQVVLMVVHADGFAVSSVFGSNMVLQRGTPANGNARAAIYGGGAAPGSSVSIAIAPRDLAAASKETVAAIADAGGAWKGLLSARPAGGTFVVTVTNEGVTHMLQNITFGDVWFCSGQSNMELNMHFTFEKNDSYQAVTKHEYSNIRFFHLGHNPAPFNTQQFVLNGSVVLANWTVADNDAVINGGVGDQCGGMAWEYETEDGELVYGKPPGCTDLDQFSAACFYFAMGLTDRMLAEGSSEVVPLGMIESAFGGTTIEQWQSIDSQLQCSNVSCHANSTLPFNKANAEACTKDVEMGNAGLWGGMVSPFVNMTLTGWTWYQGENNLFADAGNVLDKSGYACLLQQQMASWRAAWSMVPNTTPTTAPYGIVQLADATDEGWGCNMRQMHWAETGNYGVVPNPAFPDAFVAAAHDLGEPWDDGCKGPPNWCCVCANATKSPACAVGVDSPFNATTKFPWIIDHHPFVCGDTTPSTPQLMGGVHPSTKKHVGQRLAQAAWSLHYNHPEVAWTGPVVSACGIEKTAQGGSQLRIQFNKTLLGTDKIAVKAYSTADKASATFVRVGTPFPANAWNNYVYKNRAPYWGDDDTWVQVDIAQDGDTAMVVNLGGIDASKVTGVRYGQGIPGSVPQNGHKRVCCGSRDVSVNPCPPDNCPVSLASGALPAMPFIAEVLPTGDCQGLQPQVITGLGSR